MEYHLLSFFLSSIIYGIPLLFLYRRDFLRSFEIIIILYFFFCGLIFFKPYFNESKFANFFSYNNLTGENYTPTFYLNSILLYPIFLLIRAKEIVFGLNAFLSFLISLIATNSLKNITNKKYHLTIGFLFAALLIPNLYFSFFGLRDQLILIILYFLSKNLISNKLNVIILLSLLILIIRPELIVFIGFYFFWKFLGKKSKRVKIFYVFSTMMVGIFILPYTGYLLGLGKINDPLQIMEFSQNRYLRHSDQIEGGGSHILNGKLFDLNFFKRYPLQVSAFFLNPLPFDFKNISYLIPFFDSIVFIYFFIKFNRIKNLEKINYQYLFLALISTIFLLSIFNSNYGNLFRLRYPFYGVFFGAFRLYNDYIFRISKHILSKKNISDY